MRALIALSTLAAAFRTPTHRVTARKPDKKPPQTVAPILVAASTAVPVDPAPPKRRAWLRFFADTDDAPRRSARSWITEQCARGWIRDQKKRGRLALEHVERVDAVEPEECDVSEGLSRRCPDVVRLTSSGVVWIGARPGGPKLVASRLEAELVNLHRRVLTGGRRGSLVAELTMTGADLDGSLWIRRRLDGIVRKVLVKWMGKEVCVADDALDFTTTIDAGGRARVDGTARVRARRRPWSATRRATAATASGARGARGPAGLAAAAWAGLAAPAAAAWSSVAASAPPPRAAQGAVAAAQSSYAAAGALPKAAVAAAQTVGASLIPKRAALRAWRGAKAAPERAALRAWRGAKAALGFRASGDPRTL
ncbi:hypothetical protein JL720_10272 [Aureococcus anophagefferens]|nr:hypothetical protein JL720_10272 [Aureococcus anophagefferens]